MHHRRSLLCAAGFLLAAAGAAGAQNVPRSQLGTVSQMVGGTEIAITYRRPVARGRELFGALVPWGRVWTPSADSAAVLRTSGPITIDGAVLPAGSYGVWAVPERDAWTIIFSGVPHVFHLAYPEGRDVLRVRAVPTRGEHLETLAFYFPMVDADSATLRLQWGTTVVPLSIRVGAHPADSSSRPE